MSMRITLIVMLFVFAAVAIEAGESAYYQTTPPLVSLHGDN
jgi:hypothetical protein